MIFVAYEPGVVTVEFSRKQMMHMKMLERKKTILDGALSDAFGEPIALHMVLEGERGARTAPSSSATVAKQVIEQSYDIFGRSNISLED